MISLRPKDQVGSNLTLVFKGEVVGQVRSYLHQFMVDINVAVEDTPEGVDHYWENIFLPSFRDLISVIIGLRSCWTYAWIDGEFNTLQGPTIFKGDLLETQEHQDDEGAAWYDRQVAAIASIGISNEQVVEAFSTDVVIPPDLENQAIVITVLLENTWGIESPTIDESGIVNYLQILLTAVNANSALSLNVSALPSTTAVDAITDEQLIGILPNLVTL